MSYKEFILQASAARTADGDGSQVDTRDDPSLAANARAYLNVTAASGTSPTLDVTIEGLIQGVWFVVGTFTQKTGAIKDTIELLSAPALLRESHDIAGTTPSFTYTVSLSRF